VLWGREAFLNFRYEDVLAIWRERATDVRGQVMPGQHFIPEEAPAETVTALREFFLA
jgi:haloacetate dehalogenase